VSRAGGMTVLIIYTFPAILQMEGVVLPLGVPWFIPPIISLGLVSGYIADP
jgi:hypothetical protein